MRHILSRSLLTVAAASSILAVTGGYASADSDAQGATTNSPGLLSGNSVEVPVDVPVNACGNTANVVGADNAAFGNRCSNESHSHHSAPAEHSSHSDSAGHSVGQSSGHPSGHSSGAHSSGTKDSPGVGAGNALDIPLDVPLNVCGNTVDAVALLNAVMGNSCGIEEVTGAHAGSEAHSTHIDPPAGVRNLPPASGAPVIETASAAVDGPDQELLAETGASDGQLGAAGATSAALLLGGAMLYRRGRGHGPRPAHAAATARIRRTYS